MEETELILNEFLYNSGLLGFYRILEKVNKKNLLKTEGNKIIVKNSVFEKFHDYYIDAIILEFEDDTRLKKLLSLKNILEDLNLEDEKDMKIFKDILKKVKDAIESASYKAAYEIIKLDKVKEDPYVYINNIKNTKSLEEQRKEVFRILDFLKANKQVYMLKDIMYNKINVFWENMAFLNRNSNKKDIKEEYKKTFVDPVIKYINSNSKSEYNCIECRNVVSKSEAKSLAWIKDKGVDINRKKSGFWNFNDDAFACPVCSLIYSCVPMGFTMVNSNGVFINDNDSFKMLLLQNNTIKSNIKIEEDNLNKIYQNIFYILITKYKQLSNESSSENEPNNIQIIKRIGTDKDKIKYEFNTISKNKLEIFKKVKNNFKRLEKIKIYISSQKLWIDVYSEVLNNFLENKKQYDLINKLINIGINKNDNIYYIYNILKIQLYNLGGEKMEDIQKEVDDMQTAGRKLNNYFKSIGDDNKIKTYVFNLNNALRVNNVSLFMEIVTRMYCGLSKNISNSYGFAKMLKNNELFKLLGYAYILGLKQDTGDKKNENEGNNSEGGNEDEK